MAAPVISLKVELSELNNKINRFAVATGRTREDIAQQAMRGMVRYALDYTPPGSQKATGKAAQRSGEGAIDRDLKRMGFRPVDLKGTRTENPLFADPDSYHHTWIAGTALGSRPGTLFFVSRPKYNAMRTRLFSEVGKLASGWLMAAIETGVQSVPAWIARHMGELRGSVQMITEVNITRYIAINHVPDTAGNVASEMERRKGYWARYARGDLERQLHAKLAGAWGH